MNKSLKKPATSTPTGRVQKELGYVIVFAKTINISGAEYGNKNTDNSLEVSKAEIYV